MSEREEGKKEEGKAGGVWECRKGREGLVGGKKGAGEKEKTES